MDLHLVIKDVHGVLVVTPDNQMAVLLDVTPCGGQVSTHQLQERALPCKAMHGLICAVPSQHARAAAIAAAAAAAAAVLPNQHAWGGRGNPLSSGRPAG